MTGKRERERPDWEEYLGDTSDIEASVSEDERDRGRSSSSP
jgi:hypothetical protein